MGVSRAEAAKCLIDNANKENIRTLVAPEIRAAISEGTLPKDLPGEMRTYPSVQNKLNEIVGEYNKSHNLIGDKKIDAQQILSMNKKVQEKYRDLQENKNKFDQLEKDIDTYTMKKDNYISFVNHYIGKEGNWLSYIPNCTTSLDAIALLKNLNITILSPESNNSKKLIQLHQTANISNGNIVYLLHINQSHFEFLELIKGNEEPIVEEALEEEVGSSRDSNNINKPKPSITLKEDPRLKNNK